MWYPRLHEYAAFDFETEPRVERERVRLRVERDAGMPRIDCGSDQRVEYCAADSFAAPMFNDRHAPDMPVRQQTSGPDCFACRCSRERVDASLVQVVPFEFLRDTLLVDENGRADRAQRIASFMPADTLDRKLRRTRHRHEL